MFRFSLYRGLVFILVLFSTCQRVEQTLTGTYQLEVMDLSFDHHDHAEYKHFLQLDDGSRLEMKFRESDLASISTGERIAVMEPDYVDRNIIEVGAKQVMGKKNAGPGQPANDFRQRGGSLVLFVLVSDADYQNSFVPNDLLAMMYSDPLHVAGFYQEVSEGRVSFNTQVTSLSIPDQIQCSTYWLENNLVPLLKAKGINTNGFQHIIFITQGQCKYIGLARISGTIAHVDEPSAYAIAHELGHNMGLGHASGFVNGTWLEYGENSAVMGSGYHRLNAPHLVQLGWTSRGSVVAVKNKGAYTLNALYPLRSSSIITFDAGGNRYYFSLRSSTGDFDFTLAPSVTSKVHIHTNFYYSKLEQVVDVGQTYTFPNGSTLLVSSLSQDQAIIEIR